MGTFTYLNKNKNTIKLCNPYVVPKPGHLNSRRGALEERDARDLEILAEDIMIDESRNSTYWFKSVFNPYDN